MTKNVNLTRIVYAAALQRFGYYGIRSTLLLYLTKDLGMSDPFAGQVYGLFYGSMFLTSLAGGLLGDTTLGFRYAGATGLVVMFAGHLCLTPGNPAWTIAALGLYSIGYGLFDPNMNAMVGEQYPEDKDQKSRDAAYTILYTGINIGAMLGPLVCGYVALQTGWAYGFLTAGLFSLAGLPFFWAVKHQDQSEAFSKVANVGAFTSQVFSKRRLFATVAMLGLLAITFWAVFDQLGSSVTLLVERHANRQVGSFQIPAGVVQSVNPFMVVTVGILLSFRMKRRADSAIASRSTNFLFLGLLLLGAGFALLALGSIGIGSSGASARVSWLWILSAILMATLGELLFAPALTSLLSGLSPGKRRGLIMGAWSATAGIGAYLSGTMSGLMSVFPSQPIFFAISTCACWLTAAAFLISVRATRDSNTAQ